VAQQLQPRSNPLAHRVEVVNIDDAIAIYVGPADQARIARALHRIPNQQRIREIQPTIAVDSARSDRELHSEWVATD
jgi:hypothetical protein